MKQREFLDVHSKEILIQKIWSFEDFKSFVQAGDKTILQLQYHIHWL